MIPLVLLPNLEVKGFDAMAGIDGPNDPRLTLVADGGLQIGGLPRGTTSGKPSVMFCAELEDGQVLVAETTLSLFLTAADGLRAVYGDPRIDTTPTPEEPPA